MNRKELTWILGGLAGMGILAWLLFSESEGKDQVVSQPEKPPKPPARRPEAKERKMAPEKVPDKQKSASKGAVLPKPVTYSIGLAKSDLPSKQEKETLPVPVADEFPLRPGSSGKQVERLQVWLMRNYGYFGITGTFDEKTAAMVKKHLGAGQVDEKTYRRYKMGKHVTEQTIIR